MQLQLASQKREAIAAKGLYLKSARLATRGAMDHGCAPIPLTRAMSGALQRTDPRCKNQTVSPEDAEALKQLNEVLKQLAKPAGSNANHP